MIGGGVVAGIYGGSGDKGAELAAEGGNRRASTSGGGGLLLYEGVVIGMSDELALLVSLVTNSRRKLSPMPILMPVGTRPESDRTVWAVCAWLAGTAKAPRAKISSAARRRARTGRLAVNWGGGVDLCNA